MKNDPSVYTFPLKYEEIYWLAGVMGVTPLPLPGNPAQFRQGSSVEELVSRGQDSLFERGLVQRGSGISWIVDPLPAAIVRWLGGAERIAVINQVTRIEDRVHKDQMLVFPTTSEVLSASISEERIDFTFYQDHDMFVEQIVEHLFMNKKLLAADKEYRLPQPLELIPAAWDDQERAVGMLKVGGIDGEHAAETARWIQKLSLVQRLQLQQRVNGGWQASHGRVLCTDGRQLWSGDHHPDNVVTFTGINMEALRENYSAIIGYN